MSERVNDLKPHRVWMAQDAGTVIYQGRRTLTDGSEAVLLETQEAMLVKSVQRSEDFKKVAVGQTVQLDEQGKYQRPGQLKGRGR